MSFKKVASQLTGLKLILDSLQIRSTELSNKLNVTTQHMNYIISGSRSCSLVVLDSMASELCCTPNDLLGTPNSVRLGEIRVAYLQRRLTEERDRLAKLRYEASLAMAPPKIQA